MALLIDRFVQWAFQPTLWRVAFWSVVLLFAFSKIGLFSIGYIVATAMMALVVVKGWLR